MNKKFSISFHWLGREYGNPIERISLAEVSVTVDSYCVTELEDQLAKTIRRGPRLSAHALAQWFAANWWRLRWEPERTTLSWLMSHKVGAAGEGYCWPDLVFCSDGDVVTIHARQTKAEDGQLVRYLQNLDIDIPVSDWEKRSRCFS